MTILVPGANRLIIRSSCPSLRMMILSGSVKKCCFIFKSFFFLPVTAPGSTLLNIFHRHAVYKLFLLTKELISHKLLYTVEFSVLLPALRYKTPDKVYFCICNLRQPEVILIHNVLHRYFRKSCPTGAYIT